MLTRFVVLSFTVIMVVPGSVDANIGVAGSDSTIKCSFPSAAGAIFRRPRSQMFQRVERQKSILAGNVRVHYDTSGSHAPAFLDELSRPIPGTSDAFADSAASIANAVWNYQTASLGYLPPPADDGTGGGPEYDVYILDLGSLYGSTFPETPIDNKPDGVRYSTYMEIDNDFVFVDPPSNRGLPALRVTLAHEFFHAIQIGGYGLWQQHIYFYEMTATWMEDVLFDDVDDYIQYLLFGESQFSRPDLPFTSSTPIMYSRSIWGHFLEKRFGRDALRTTWEFSIQYSVPPLTAMDLALQTNMYQSNLRDAFSEWTLWNYFTGSRFDPDYYPEGDQYPLIAENTVQFNQALDTLGGSLPPLTAMYYRVTSNGAPLELAASNLDLTAAEAGIIAEKEFSYFLSSVSTDPDYQETLSGVYVKTSVDNPYNWHTWAVVNGVPSELGAELPPVASQDPFPSPFSPGVHRSLNVPLGPDYPPDVQLSIFSSDMSLVYSATVITSLESGQRVVRWDGKTSSGDIAQTGIYFFAATGNGRLAKGKFALVRR